MPGDYKDIAGVCEGLHGDYFEVDLSFELGRQAFLPPSTLNPKTHPHLEN